MTAILPPEHSLRWMRRPSPGGGARRGGGGAPSPPLGRPDAMGNPHAIAITRSHQMDPPNQFVVPILVVDVRESCPPPSLMPDPPCLRAPCPLPQRRSLLSPPSLPPPPYIPCGPRPAGHPPPPSHLPLRCHSVPTHLPLTCPALPLGLCSLHTYGQKPLDAIPQLRRRRPMSSRRRKWETFRVYDPGPVPCALCPVSVPGGGGGYNCQTQQRRFSSVPKRYLGPFHSSGWLEPGIPISSPPRPPSVPRIPPHSHFSLSFFIFSFLYFPVFYVFGHCTSCFILRKLFTCVFE